MSLIETTLHGAVHELRLARAPVNALDPALCEALTQALADAVAAGAQGIVLAGGPKVFSAGLDVPYLLSLGNDQEALLRSWTLFFEAARALAACPVPVVAALAGHSPAGGCVLALCCDYRVMAEGPYRIGLNETQVGLVAPEGIQSLLARMVGPHRAERLLVAGIAQRFSMRPNPACIGMPPGSRRIQPSFTRGAQSRAAAVSGNRRTANSHACLVMRL